MSETHLPECFMLNESTIYDPGICICKRLRQAEQRVVVKREGNGELWLDGFGTGYGDGYAAGVQAAREAVEKVGQQHPKWDLMSTHYEGCWKSHPECALTLALDAIGGLRGES